MATDRQKEARREREHRREEKQKTRRLLGNIALWAGVVILVAILLYWLFAIGTFEGPDQ